MNSESTPPNAPEKEVQKTISYVDNAIKITEGRIQDETLLKNVIGLFGAIRLLCKQNLDRARELQLTASELLGGVTAEIDTPDKALLKREIEYATLKLADILAGENRFN
jgi:hypothetical protein